MLLSGRSVNRNTFRCLLCSLELMYGMNSVCSCTTQMSKSFFLLLLRFPLDSDCNIALLTVSSDKPSAVVLGLSIHMLSVPVLLAHLYATKFNIQQSYVLPHTTVFMCFVWISEQTAIISLYSVN